LTVTIRQFRREDTSAVLGLANEHAAFDGTTSEADLAVTAHFPKGFWVAEDESKIVGFAYGYFKDVPSQVLERWGVTKVGHVELMAVAPSHRRKGTATALLGRLLKEFKDAGAEMVLLDCPAEAAGAKKLYDKMGFEPRFYGMRKRL
jgi:ribosomal protein S18 acetylase RimI-like enzyme